MRMRALLLLQQPCLNVRSAATWRRRWAGRYADASAAERRSVRRESNRQLRCGGAATSGIAVVRHAVTARIRALQRVAVSRASSLSPCGHHLATTYLPLVHSSCSCAIRPQCLLHNHAVIAPHRHAKMLRRLAPSALTAPTSSLLLASSVVLCVPRRLVSTSAALSPSASSEASCLSLALSAASSPLSCMNRNKRRVNPANHGARPCNSVGRKSRTLNSGSGWRTGMRPNQTRPPVPNIGMPVVTVTSSWTDTTPTAGNSSTADRH